MTRPLRVVIVARAVYPLHGLGGLERSVFDLTRHLIRQGVEVTLVTRTPADPPAPGAIDPRLTLQLVPYRTFPGAGRRGTTVLDRSTAYPIFGLRAGKAAYDLVRAGRADIVHGFGASVLGYARRRHLVNAPLVLNPQGLEEFGATNPSGARLKRAAYLPLRAAVLICARAADRIIATDRALEPAVLEHLKVPREHVRVIPNALDLEAVDAMAGAAEGRRARETAGIAPRERVLLSVGRLEENKGFHVLVAALAALGSHSGPVAEDQWCWVLVGDGPYRGRLEAAIRDAGLGHRVILTGRLPDRQLHAWYEATDLFVHPTLYEGSSLVTLEAMAHRRAVVATRAGGLPDKVKPGANGWLVEPGDPAGLAAALSGALAEPGRLTAFGEAGRAIVEREFAWPAVAARTIELYREIL
ncbi:MAG: glycosyltransferase family 4 protein [Acidobacteria bacterium]|nr:glycosyltransferase family 4 protein [Acidobacteriota bacterium]MBA3888746.1 glycosyltransferase family 4 protein [Acidobacteriota bacterium]